MKAQLSAAHIPPQAARKVETPAWESRPSAPSSPHPSSQGCLGRLELNVDLTKKGLEGHMQAGPHVPEPNRNAVFS